MINRPFLETVLDAEGLYCVFGLKDKQPTQKYADSFEAIQLIADRWLNNGMDVYFGTATFATDKKREHANTSRLKCFKIDLDCGVSKPYDTQQEAFEALQAFINKLGLPKPTLVNSGRGIHVYWGLETSVTYKEWKPVADSLARLCEKNGLEVDTSVTANASGVLRLPNTKNFKDKPPKNVKLVQLAPTVAFEDFVSIVGSVKPEELAPLFESGEASPPPRELMDATTRALMGNSVSKFGTIMKKSLAGKGCAQLANIFKNQEDIDYNLWRGGLSIAGNCEDASTAVHKISHRHPEYSAQETELRAKETQGKPYKCATFEAIYAKGCEGCELKGTMTSPIQIGSEIAEASGEDNIVVMRNAVLEEEVTVEIPKYPFPYFRGKNGGVYRRGMTVAGTDERAEDELIYEYDLYVIKRLTDPDDGESIWVRLHMPKDGIREFTCPLAHVIARDKFAGVLAYHGVAASGKKLENIMTYVTRWVSELQQTLEAEKARQQFGWCDDDRKFILGNREITAKGVNYSPSSSATADVAVYYNKKGDIHKWTQMADIYGLPGNEVRAFTLFAGFGSVLLKFTNLHGGIIHLTNNSSGVGKTTIQAMVNSIWGHPNEAMVNQEDKYLARMHRMAVLGNIPLCIDEMTNAANEEVSGLSYAVTHGRPRNLMQSQANAERANSLRWSLIAITSGNKSLHDQLYSLKDFPEGELMRILEFNVNKTDAMTKEESDAAFSPLNDNFGIAGEIFVRYVIANLPEVLTLLSSIQRKFDLAAGMTQRERYWSAMAACAITAGLLAERLALHNIDTGRVYRWAVKQLMWMKGDVSSENAITVGPLTHIGMYLNEKNNNLLVINSYVDRRSGIMEAPIREPRGELLSRYEPDSKKLFISAKPLRLWCSMNQVSYKAMKENLTALKIMDGEMRKSMARGTDMSTPAVPALVIDCVKAKEYDLNIDDLLEDGQDTE